MISDRSEDEESKDGFDNTAEIASGVTEVCIFFSLYFLSIETFDLWMKPERGRGRVFVKGGERVERELFDFN